MVTTVGGLIVGIIAYIAYNYLVSKIDKVIFQLEARTVFVKLSINANDIIKVESDFSSFCESISISG